MAKRKFRHRHSAIEIQIHADILAPHGTTFTRELIHQAILRRADGDTTEGIDLSIVRWRHPRRPWIEPDQDQDDIWHKFRRLLHAARLSVRTIRRT